MQLPIPLTIFVSNYVLIVFHKHSIQRLCRCERRKPHNKCLNSYNIIFHELPGYTPSTGSYSLVYAIIYKKVSFIN
jgi:hypothetical protein